MVVTMRKLCVRNYNKLDQLQLEPTRIITSLPIMKRKL